MQSGQIPAEIKAMHDQSTAKLAENRVTIRYWAPDSPGSFGHVSLQTYRGGTLQRDSRFSNATDTNTGYYISFWPGGRKNILSKPFPYRLLSLQQDIELHGKSPNTEINLYSLNPEKVNLNFEEFIQGDAKFHLFGALKFGDQQVSKSNECCSGLTYALLCNAGLRRLYERLHTEQVGKSMEKSARPLRHFSTSAMRTKNPVAMGMVALAWIGTGLYKAGEVTYEYFSKNDIVVTPKFIVEIATAHSQMESQSSNYKSILANLKDNKQAGDNNATTAPLYDAGDRKAEASTITSELKYETDDEDERATTGIIESYLREQNKSILGRHLIKPEGDKQVVGKRLLAGSLINNNELGNKLFSHLKSKGCNVAQETVGNNLTVSIQLLQRVKR